MKLFWTCLVVDCLVFLVAFYWFLVGLGDGTVSSFNILIWIPLVGIPAAVIGGGLYLRANGRPGAAKALLALLAVPGLLAALALLAVFVMFAMHPGGHH